MTPHREKAQCAMNSPFHRPADWRTGGLTRVFVRDLTLPAQIGVHPHEIGVEQPIVISIELIVDTETEAESVYAPPPRAEDPTAASVVCYESLSNMVRALLAEGHIDYVESLADQIVTRCLADPRVFEAAVRVEKPTAIPEAAGAGVELIRRR